MVPGRRGEWARREFRRRLSRLVLLGLLTVAAGGLVSAVLSGQWWWALLAGAAIPVLDRSGWRRALGFVGPAEGADGEEGVAVLLSHLEPHGYRVLHGVDIGSGEIDHLVVGPTGVFAVGTTAYPGGIHLSRGRLMRRGGELHSAVEQARAQAVEVKNRLLRAGIRSWAESVVAVTDGRLPRGPILLPGVTVMAAEDVASFILEGRNALSPGDVPRAVVAILREEAPVVARSLSHD